MTPSNFVINSQDLSILSDGTSFSLNSDYQFVELKLYNSQNKFKMLFSLAPNRFPEADFPAGIEILFSNLKRLKIFKEPPIFNSNASHTIESFNIKEIKNNSKERTIHSYSTIVVFANGLKISIEADFVILQKSDKQVIFSKILDEAVDVWGPVWAKFLKQDLFEIIGEQDNEFEDENWEFKKGDIVRCEKIKLSLGEVIVAKEKK